MTGGRGDYYLDDIYSSSEVLLSNGTFFCSIAEMTQTKLGHTQSGLTACGGYSGNDNENQGFVLKNRKSYWKRELGFYRIWGCDAMSVSKKITWGCPNTFAPYELTLSSVADLSCFFFRGPNNFCAF